MEHAPQNAMTEAGEVERFRDRCSELMAALLDELARTPDEPRTFPDVERALSWPGRWEIWVDAAQAKALRRASG